MSDFRILKPATMATLSIILANLDVWQTLVQSYLITSYDWYDKQSI